MSMIVARFVLRKAAWQARALPGFCTLCASALAMLPQRHAEEARAPGAAFPELICT
jgi:hypothetical protein